MFMKCPLLDSLKYDVMKVKANGGPYLLEYFNGNGIMSWCLPFNLAIELTTTPSSMCVISYVRVSFIALVKVTVKPSKIPLNAT
jgi:hypothetical protein